MTNAKISDKEFIEGWREWGPAELVRRYGLDMRSTYARRRSIEDKYRIRLQAPNEDRKHLPAYEEQSARRQMTVENGIVIVGSDLHAWPGEPSTAFRAFLRFIKDMKPVCVVLNGDVIDGASVSRHPPIGWEKNPTLVEEIEVAQERLHDVMLVAGKKTRLIWPLGNHDARFSTRLATVAPEYAKINGTRLQDHFGERWEPCWSFWINPDRPDGPVIKHRTNKGGMHAAQNSTLWSGRTMILGHQHSMKVAPFTDYQSTRFGVDTGCLADVYGPQFRYQEDNAVNWRSGFAVLTFKDGRLMWPELVHVVGAGQVEFRGAYVSV